MGAGMAGWRVSVALGVALCVLVLLACTWEASADEDYYGLLGLTRGASDADIKRAYKKLALKWHPDVYKGADQDEAKKKFQKLSHAYEILKDKEKRAVYDQYGEEGLKQQAGRGGGGGFTDPFDLFNSFGFGFPGGQRGQRGQRDEERTGPPLHVDLEASLEDLYNGRSLTVTQKKQILCHRCRGTGAEDPDDVTKCPVCGGSGVRLITQQLGPGFITQTQTTCDKCGGKGKIVKGTCPVCKGHKVESGEDTITVIVEKGMRDGHEITFQGESHEHPEHLPGDLIFKITTVPHSRFIRKENDLYMNATITLLQALVGFKKVYKHLDGHSIIIERSGVTKPGLVMTVPGEGMPMYEDSDRFGDLHVEFTIKFPTTVTDEQKEGFKKLLKKEKKDGSSSESASSSSSDKTEL
jgi:DnaJ-related protein SCJ1